MNCLTYARVSTDKQADRELSIPAQLQAMRHYADHRGWSIVEEFIESGISGRTADRPGLRALLSRCRQATPRVDMILVHKIDRLTRNLADHLALRSMLKEQGIALASVVEQLDDSISGRLVEHIMASLAEFYSANLSEEVKKGLRQKILQGGWPHLAPLGYRHQDRRVVIDPILGPAIRRCFELYGRGETTLEGLSGLMARDGHRLPVSTLQRVLRNPFYAGQLRWHGQFFPGRHEPLVAPDFFDRVQQLLNARRRRLRTSPRCDRWLRGFATCAECGALMAAERHGPLSYYRCRGTMTRARSCRARYCNATVAEAAVRDRYGRLPMLPALRKSLAGSLKKQGEGERRRLDDELAYLHARLRQTEKQAIALASSLAEGLTELDVYRLAADRLKTERASLLRRRATLVASRPHRVVMPKAVATLDDFHNQLPLVLQQALLKIVFVDLKISRSGIASCTLRPPFDVLYDQHLSVAA